MGSGKSTIGPILANVLGYEFCDLDKFISSKTDKTILQIFETIGEKGFRDIETESVEILSRNKKFVIALGGGTIQNEKIFNLLKKTGMIIYLKVEIENLLKRLKNKGNRPILLSSKGEKLSEIDLKNKINELFYKRKKYYEKSDLIIKTDLTSVGKTVDSIIFELNKIQ